MYYRVAIQPGSVAYLAVAINGAEYAEYLDSTSSPLSCLSAESLAGVLFLLV